MKVLNSLFFVSLLTVANAQLVRVSDNVVKDEKTNFLWQDTKDVKMTKRNYKEANIYCSNLELDGSKNWKVPTFLAAFSIVDTKLYNPTLSKEFKNFVSDNYWTTKTFGHGTSGEAFVVNYLSGAFNRFSMEDKFYVRCYKDLNN